MTITCTRTGPDEYGATLWRWVDENGVSASMVLADWQVERFEAAGLDIEREARPWAEAVIAHNQGPGLVINWPGTVGP